MLLHVSAFLLYAYHAVLPLQPESMTCQSPTVRESGQNVTLATPFLARALGPASTVPPVGCFRCYSLQQTVNYKRRLVFHFSLVLPSQLSEFKL